VIVSVVAIFLTRVVIAVFLWSVKGIVVQIESVILTLMVIVLIVGLMLMVMELQMLQTNQSLIKLVIVKAPGAKLARWMWMWIMMAYLMGCVRIAGKLAVIQLNALGIPLVVLII
jgi:hypothetical protein